MNIMFLIFSFNTGGIEKQLIEMTDNMTTKGHHICICIINHRYEEVLLGKINKKVNIVKFDRPEKSKHKLRYMLRLAKIVKDNNIQIIHCQEPTGVVFSVIAKRMNPGVKIVETIHDIGESRLYSKSVLRAADLICDIYIAISESVRKEIIDRGISDKKTELITDAVNTKEYQQIIDKDEDRAANSIQETDNILDKRLMLGNVARFFPEKKGQDVLVRAIEILMKKYPDIHCSLAGGIYRGQEENWDKLQKYISDHGLGSNVFLCGNLDNIPEFLSTIGIFVLPSLYEGFGISLIEAMSMGIPCVASNIDGPKEIITDSSLGVLAEPGNEYDLADKIDYVICNYDSYNQADISRYITERYDIGKMVDKHLQLYMNLVECVINENVS